MTETDARSAVLDCLLLVSEKGKFLHTVLNAALSKYAWMSSQDRAFLSRLLHGTLEYQIQEDGILDQISSVRTDKMNPVIRNILRMSVYQILYLDRVPDSAVVNEAVNLTRKRGFTGLTGFVNGVLRKIGREKTVILKQISGSSDLSFRYSVPQWMVNIFLRETGREKTETILKTFLSVSPVCVRLGNSLLRDPQKTEEWLKKTEKEAKAVFSPYRKDILYLSGFDRLEDISLIRSGNAFVQDFGSVLAVTAADPKKEDIIFDVCAAPGGKSLEAADIMDGTGSVRAMDISEEKAGIIRENIEKSGLKNIRAEVRNAEIYDASLNSGADIVLADLPCSGLGVLGRKPDIKLHASEEGCRELALLQRRILDNVCRYVKKGGRLVYSTCTIDPAENEENREYFLKKHPEFTCSDLSGIFSFFSGEETLKQGYIQLLPGIHPCGGFFIAAFHKKDIS